MDFHESIFKNYFWEWIKAEIEAGIADHEQDAGGYYFTGYEERKIAERLFKEVCGALIKN